MADASYSLQKGWRRLTYSREFYGRSERYARRSAERIVPVLLSAWRPDSVLDVGCGAGAWLAAWRAAGIGDLHGVDTAAIEDSGYLLDAGSFTQRDLSRPFDLGRRFSLVQSLEVAEHLPEAVATGFVRSLCRHSDIVLFSAAPPGQGGLHHVNEQPYAYWQARFAAEGYRPIDWLRPLIARDGEISWWYRYNILLFANEAGFATLPGPIRAAMVPSDAAIGDLSPLFHRCRRLILRQLSPKTVTQLAGMIDTLSARNVDKHDRRI
jgi:hypothetical protein